MGRILLLLFVSFTLKASAFSKQSINFNLANTNKGVLEAVSIISADTIISTNDSVKVRKKSNGIDWNNLPYLFDDMTIVFGLSRSGLYYTENYRELSHIGGWSIGVEDFLPVFDRAFFHFGLKYAQRGFEHERHSIKFITHNIDMPLFLSYELPALRSFDFRLLFGGQFTLRTGSERKGSYISPGFGDSYYFYRPSEFNRYDFGFTFGLSAEHNNIYFRLRGFSGYRKLMPDDTGMNSAFSAEVGYFVFRNLRK
jgi:hypothetical protein